MDKIYSITKKKLKQDNARTLIILVLVSLMILTGLYGVYRVLEYNANSMGEQLVQSYIADEERNASIYRTIIKMGMAHYDNMTGSAEDEEIVTEHMFRFFETASETAGDPDLQCYAIINGKLLSSTSAEIKEDVSSYKEMSWYKEALEADGEPIFKSGISYGDGQELVVAAAVEPETGNAVIFHLRESDFANTHKDLNLPEQGAYYLCDEEGRLLYYQAPFTADREEIKAYAEEIGQKLLNGEIPANGSYIKDITGERRAVYSARMSNGWVSIMTIPHATLFSGFNQVLMILLGAFLAFLALMIVFFVRDGRLGHRMLHSSVILRALSNNYYAIYLIDLKEATYQMIKGSKEMQGEIPVKAGYSTMLSGFCKVVDEETATELKESFSFKHIKELAEKKVGDFGGDLLRMMNGEQKWVNISLILDEGLEEDQVLLVFRQIDSEKRKQIRHTRLLEDALAAADASEKSQKEFFSKMSHELRTPLNIILGMNELAMHNTCSEEKRLDYEKKIDYTGREMLKLINNILEISRVEDGMMPIERKNFNLCEVFCQIVQPFQEKAKAEGKRFFITMDVDKKEVMGDVLKLEQILNNLLSNAMHFTQWGDKISVSLRQASMESKNYIFTVEDTGIGMSEKFLTKLFEPYSQENRFTDHRQDGNGLGMTIVKSLVTQKGGQIAVESTVGKGTKVVVTLPFAQQPELMKQEAKQQEQEGMKDLRMLVVDDNDLNRELISELLTEQGAKVTQACDGKEALDIFAKSEAFSFDVILMDMQMPVMDGCEAAKAIRAMDRVDAGWVLIIALTANSFSEDVTRTVQAGMDAHLAKPANLKIMGETIRKLIARRAGME